jgi:beta-lactam-binding protein with PASTA domain
MFKGLIQFLKSKTFFKHLAIYIVSIVLICWIIISWLGHTTNHGESVTVPDFSGVKLAELDKFVSDKNLRYLVIDSIYDTKAPKGAVLKQEPEAGAKVKENRTIYLYVTSILPPSIQMPKLIDRSLRQAAAMISTFGLKLKLPIQFRSDQCANCVLEQKVKGEKIEPGATIPKGTVIELVVGKGLSDQEVGVPCLYGLSRAEALAKLSDASLSVGSIIFDNPKDSTSSAVRVYRQSPSCSKDASINMGGTIDLYFTTDKNRIPAPDTSSIKKNSNEDFD